jgi:negative regulator of flagellin synthesis FlgM
MKIRENGQTVSNVYNKPAAEKKHKESVQDLQTQKDILNISPKFKEISQAIDRVPKESIRTEKIQEIKKQIEDGTYQIQPEQIAKKMLSDE